MVNSEEFKRKIKELISQDYKIEFLGNNFYQIVRMLSDIKAEKIYSWVERVIKEGY